MLNCVLLTRTVTLKRTEGEKKKWEKLRGKGLLKSKKQGMGFEASQEI